MKNLRYKKPHTFLQSYEHELLKVKTKKLKKRKGEQKHGR